MDYEGLGAGGKVGGVGGLLVDRSSLPLQAQLETPFELTWRLLLATGGAGANGALASGLEGDALKVAAKAHARKSWRRNAELAELPMHYGMTLKVVDKTTGEVQIEGVEKDLDGNAQERARKHGLYRWKPRSYKQIKDILSTKTLANDTDLDDPED